MKYTTKAAEKSTVKITIELNKEEWTASYYKYLDAEKVKLYSKHFKAGEVVPSIVDGRLAYDIVDGYYYNPAFTGYGGAFVCIFCHNGSIRCAEAGRYRL